MRFWVKILSKSAETLGRKGFYILWKKAGERTPGLRPGPGFDSRSFPTRWFLWWLFLMRSRDYFVRYPNTDLGRIFRKNMLKKHFMKESLQIRVHTGAP